MMDAQVSNLDPDTGSSISNSKHSSSHNLHFDCTERCRSIIHGAQICQIAGQSNLNDREVIRHWFKVCQNYGHVKDEFGKMGIHVAASTGKHKALEFLIKHEGCNLNVKDLISGYTPLHRSIFNGQIHVARNLITMGANLSLTDNEGLGPLDIWTKDRQNYLPVSTNFNPVSDPTELYIWGTNDNYNLGTEGGQSSRLVPEPLEKFRKEPNIKISQVVLQTYHTAFLSQNGDVYCCGVGQGGRLGTGSETPSLVPQKIKFKSTEKVTSIAAGVDHTIFLLDNGTVRTCGSNEYFVLGHNPPPEKLLTSRTIETLKSVQIQGIKGGYLHSIFYTSTQLYVCGWNGGQFGPGFELSKSGSAIIVPKRVTSVISISGDTDTERRIGATFTHVECNDVGIAVCNSNGNLFLLYKSDIRRISTKSFDIVSIRLIGGTWASEAKQNLSSKFHQRESTGVDCSDFTPLTLLILTTTGRIYVWRENLSSVASSKSSTFDGLGNWTRVIFTNIGRSIPIKSFTVGRSSMLVLSESGEGFSCSWTPGRSPYLALNINHPSLIKRPKTDSDWGQLKKRGGKDLDLISLPLELVKVKRLPNIFTGEVISSDPKGTAFAILQRNPKLDFVEVPLLSPSTMNQNLNQLLQEANVEDALHDVVFKVGSMTFPAHQFVIATSCPALLKSSKEIESLKVPIHNVNSHVFNQILQFVYTNSCDILTNPHAWTNLLQSTEKISACLKETIQYARKLGLGPLCKRLEQMEVSPDNEIRMKTSIGSTSRFTISKSKKFNRDSFINLADITFETLDKIEIKAHRCILVSRMTYFHSMLFGNTWRESLSNRLTLPITSKSLGCLLDFVYMDDLPGLASMDLESVADVLQAGDQFLVEGLVPHVEVVLSELLSLKNVGDILRMSYFYNAEQLRNSCFSFIALNLGQLLENRLLDGVEVEILEDVSKYYQNVVAPIQNVRRLKVDLLKLDEDEEMENKELERVLEEFDKYFSSSFHTDETFEPTATTTFKSKSPKITKLFKTRNRTRHFSQSSIENVQPDSPSQQQADIYPGSSNPCPSDWVKVQSHHHTHKPSKTTQFAPITSPTPPKSVKAFGSENKSIKGNPASSTVIPLPKIQIPIPNKEQGMKAENAKIRQLEVKFQSMLDFPCLGGIQAKNVDTNSLSTHGKHIDQKVLPLASPPAKTSSTKKKTRWVTLPPEIISQPSEEIISLPSSPPKNPWKINLSSPNPSPTTKIETFENILDEERQKKQNLERALEKSVHLTQIEERAIEEFLSKYTTEDTRRGTEILRVNRVTTCQFAKPVWPLK